MSAEHIDSYTLQAPGISATVISWGAALQSLFIKDKAGKERDVVVGFDDPNSYREQRTFNGTVIGRYANRIKRGAFTVNGQSYQLPTNEGKNTLHGGSKGYDQVNWTLTSRTETSLTLSFLDKSETEGFPGDVLNHITYTVDSNPVRLTVRLISLSLNERTPIMPTTHTFWNLSGFQTPTILDDTLHLPHASRVITGDAELIPTGELFDVKKAASGGNKHLLDYTTAKKIAADAREGEFGGEGPGIDHAYVFDIEETRSSLSNEAQGPVQFQWSSPATGIRLTLKTNQHGIQVYTAVHHNGSTVVKQSQRGGESDQIQKFGCLAMEPQDYIDAVNNPAWGRDGKQLFGPRDGPNVNWTEYAFDTI